MILNYNYFYFVSALSPEVCDGIIELGLEKMLEIKKEYGENATQAVTGDDDYKLSEKLSPDALPQYDSTIEEIVNNTSNPTDVFVRDSNVSWLNEKWLYEAIWPFVHEANKKAGWNFEWDHTEDLQFTKYGVNQFYGWHADSAPFPYEKFDSSIHEYKLDKDGLPRPSLAHHTEIPLMEGKIRKLSVTVSLNDPKEYDGGNLKFDLGPHREDRYHTCEEIRPRGSIIIFPSHIHHQVTPVTRGTRYSLVAWNLGQPFK